MLAEELEEAEHKSIEKALWVPKGAFPMLGCSHHTPSASAAAPSGITAEGKRGGAEPHVLLVDPCTKHITVKSYDGISRHGAGRHGEECKEEGKAEDHCKRDEDSGLLCVSSG
jgi:hypothetical protein